jgi:type IV pilus assembly protein PilM
MNAYGYTELDHRAIEKGVIVDTELITRKAYELITTNINGKITYDRVAFSIPNEFSFSRVLTLPKMNKKDLGLTLENELQQSMPLSSDELYYDYDVVDLVDQQEIQLVATPKKIVDSYLAIGKLLGLETAYIETNIGAVTRAVRSSEITKSLVSLIIDIGSSAADLTLFDGSEIRITTTANCGGNVITKAIADELDINSVQAHIIKTRYGLDPSKKQKQITKAISVVLDRLFIEIRKVEKYITEHSKDKQIEQIIIVGGGSNIPGISSYMTNKLKIPTRVCNAWKTIEFNDIPKPDQIENTLYTTAIGLAMGDERDFIK